MEMSSVAPSPVRARRKSAAASPKAAGNAPREVGDLDRAERGRLALRAGLAEDARAGEVVDVMPCAGRPRAVAAVAREADKHAVRRSRTQPSLRQPPRVEDAGPKAVEHHVCVGRQR